MRFKRNRLALLGILTLALSVTVGLTIDGAAVAKKKKGGGGGTKTFSKGGAAIPDAKNNCLDTNGNGSKDCQGNGGEYNRGVLVSKIVIGEKFATAKAKDLNVSVDINHADISDVFVQLVGPRGGLVTLFDGTTNSATPPAPGTFFTKLGPTLFDDQAAVYVNDTVAATDPGALPTDGAEAFAPYAGNFKPADGTLASLGSKLMGTWYLLVIDFDPVDSTTDPVQIGSLVRWKLIAALKGGGGGKKKK